MSVTSDLPPRTGEPPTVWNEYARMGYVGHHQSVELYVGQEQAADVLRYCVRRLKPHHFRAVVLYERPGRAGSRLHCCESDRETVRRWLVDHGVPALRIGR